MKKTMERTLFLNNLSIKRLMSALKEKYTEVKKNGRKVSVKNEDGKTLLFYINRIDGAGWFITAYDKDTLYEGNYDTIFSLIEAVA